MLRPDSAESSSGEHLLVDAVMWLYAALTFVLGIFIVSAPLPTLLDRFIPDDVFYYLNTARHFATSGFSSFDGLHFTNGYQPLWFLLCVPIHWVFPQGGELPLRVMLVVQLACSVGAAALMARLVAAWCGALAAAVAGLLWLVVFQRATINGLETAIHSLVFAWLLHLFLRLQRVEPDLDRRRLIGHLGAAAALLFLARTDAIFLIAALTAWLIGRRRHLPRVALTRFALPVGLTMASYLLLNLWTTGHLMPVSGAGKMYHSSIARAAAAPDGSTTAAAMQNLLWPFTDPAPWAIVALVAPLLLFATGAASRPDSFARRTAATWPFIVGIWATYLFYGLAFYGGFSRTLWYYGPLLLFSWFSLAALGVLLVATPGWRPVAWVVPFAAIGIGLRWLGGISLAIAALGPSIVARAAGGVRSRLQLIAMLAIVATAIHTWMAFARHGIWISSWQLAVVVAAVLAGFISMERFPRLALVQVVVGLVIPTVLVHGKNLAGDVTAAPSNWNYHLLRGAEWARATLPKDAVLWSGSAGILGYFSGHRVVNTDGLANSYAFLENILKPRKLGAFVRQFDYAIDAYADDSLQTAYPEGCFVPLPPGVAPPAFADGTLTRQLRVFQMRPAGIVTCR